MSDKPAYVKPPKNALNHPKLRLQAPNPNVKGKYASLSWDVYSNNPRIVVSTNDPAMSDNRDKNFGRITAAMTTPGFYVFLDNLKTAIESEGPVRPKMENYTVPKNSPFGSPPVLANDTYVGKDQEGCVFITVVNKEQEGWPIIKFVFGPVDNRFEKHYRTDGTELTKADYSIAYAKAYLKLLEQMMAAVLVKHYVEPPPYVPKNGQAGGYGAGRGNGGGGGGYNNQRAAAPAPAAADDYSDDLNF